VKLLLGGWSLGGHLALEVAHRLAGDPDVAIIGLIFVDTIYPVPPAGHPRKIAPRLSAEPPVGASGTQALVHRCLAHARAMFETYSLPEDWRESTASATTLTSPSTSREAQVQPSQSELSSPPTPAPPPTVLVRARDYVPTLIDAISMVDVYRDDERLGWGNYNRSFIKGVLEIKTHHFDMFSRDHLLEASQMIKQACDMLEDGTT
jgi:thioesterase domain-containing protein